MLKLTVYQKNRLELGNRDFIQFNAFVQDVHYAACPVCGMNEPRIITKGVLNGKLRFIVRSTVIGLSRHGENLIITPTV